MFLVLFRFFLLHIFLFLTCVDALKALGLLSLERGFVGAILAVFPLILFVLQLLVLLVLLRGLGLPDGPVDPDLPARHVATIEPHGFRDAVLGDKVDVTEALAKASARIPNKPHVVNLSNLNI